VFPHQKISQSKLVEPLKTGEILIKEGLVCPDDIDTALLIQKNRANSLTLKKNRLLGMILCDLNLVTPVDTYWVLHKYNKLTTIQSELVSKKMLSLEMVLSAQDASRADHIPLISILLKKKLVSTTGMQRLLFDLFHIPFRSISDFIFKEKDKYQLLQVMDRKAALENGILPLVLKSNTLLFGITDPQNIVFIKKLNEQFPQYRFKALFMPYSGFTWFFDIIYKTQPKETSTRENALDQSLLLSFKATIKTPEKENNAIRALYENYERLRQFIGNPARESLAGEFYEFISTKHQEISQDYKSQIIEFSLKKEDQDVKVMAVPK